MREFSLHVKGIELPFTIPSKNTQNSYAYNDAGSLPFITYGNTYIM